MSKSDPPDNPGAKGVNEQTAEELGRDSNDAIRQLLERSTWGQPGIPGFSFQASSKVSELAGRYSADLTLQAIRVAKQKNSEVVSVSDVDMAFGAMHTGRRTTLAKALEPLGGFLAGTGGSIFGGAIFIKNAPVAAYAAAFVLVATGIWILASSFAKH